MRGVNTSKGALGYAPKPEPLVEALGSPSEWLANLMTMVFDDVHEPLHETINDEPAKWVLPAMLRRTGAYG